MKNFCYYGILALVLALLAALLPEPLKVQHPKCFLRLQLKTFQSGMSQLFWDIKGGFAEQNSEKSPIYAKGKFITQKYLLPSQYRQLRFDPFNGSGECELKDCSIVDIDDKLIRKIDLDRIKPFQQIKVLKIENGIVGVKTSENAHDPILIIQDSVVPTILPWYIVYGANIKFFVATFFIVMVLAYLGTLSLE